MHDAAVIRRHTGLHSGLANTNQKSQVTDIASILFYVTDPAESKSFYAAIFDRDPVEANPTFAMFVLPSGLGAGLWKKDGVRPAPVVTGACCDIGIKVHEAAAVDAMHREWTEKGATIAMAPSDLDFGRSFVATDPDGHRLRVCAMAEEM
jgi:predicted enzyme related to lactoylglutathione lyase